MDLYFHRHDGAAVTCDDFRAAMADAASDEAVARLINDHFEEWYTQSGTPTLVVEARYEETAGGMDKAGTADLVLTLTQSLLDGSGGSSSGSEGFDGGSIAPALVIPVRLGILDPVTGDDCVWSRAPDDDAAGSVPIPILHGDTLVLTERSQEIRLQGVPSPGANGGGEGGVLSVLRNFSAPVRLVVVGQTREDLAFMMAHDGDSFNRYEAARKMSESVLLGLVEELREGGGEGGEEGGGAAGGARVAACASDPLFLESFRKFLLDDTVDASLRAAALALPSFQELAGTLKLGGGGSGGSGGTERDGVICPTSICEARRVLRETLGARLGEEFHHVLSFSSSASVSPSSSSSSSSPASPTSPATPPYEFTPAQVGRRRLDALCLSYLSAVRPIDDRVVQLTKGLFDSADNMTDQRAAMACLAELDVPEREEALAAFAARWRDDTLVMDKWFSVQAQSSLPGAAERCKALMEHDAFVFTNPNKLRAVVGAFARGNPAQFHALDGSGYALLGEAIVAIDPVNGQLGAALAKIFLDWTQFDAARRTMIRAELEKILANEAGVSSNTAEVVAAALAAAVDDAADGGRARARL